MCHAVVIKQLLIVEGFELTILALQLSYESITGEKGLSSSQMSCLKKEGKHRQNTESSTPQKMDGRTDFDYNTHQRERLSGGGRRSG